MTGITIQEDDYSDLTFTWKLISLKKTNNNNLNDVIVQTYWQKTGVDADGNEGVFMGATPFNISDVDSNNFVPYEQLTEEIIVGWIQTYVQRMGSYQSNSEIRKQINAKKNPPVIDVLSGDFPWSPAASANTI
jgi:hypothetical protein